MYVKDFIFYVFDFIHEATSFGLNLGLKVIELVTSLYHLVTALPLWITVPFYALLVIAVLFRVSQFIPTIGGAS